MTARTMSPNSKSRRHIAVIPAESHPDATAAAIGHNTVKIVTDHSDYALMSSLSPCRFSR